MSGWSESDVGFRPLTTGDLPLVYDWLGREHVSRWWGARAAYDEAVAEYLDALEGRDPTDLYVIVLAGEDVGLIQTYLLAGVHEDGVLGVVREEIGLDQPGVFTIHDDHVEVGGIPALDRVAVLRDRFVVSGPVSPPAAHVLASEPVVDQR